MNKRTRKEMKHDQEQHYCGLIAHCDSDTAKESFSRPVYGSRQEMEDAEQEKYLAEWEQAVEREEEKKMMEKVTDVLLNVLFLIFSPVLLLISLICFFVLPSRDEQGYVNECSGCKMGQDKNYCKTNCKYYRQIEKEREESARKMDTNNRQ